MKSYNFLTYNTDFKISGNIITYKSYDNTQYYNFMKDPSLSPILNLSKINEIYNQFIENLNNYRFNYISIIYRYTQNIIEEEKKERYIKTCFRARQAIFDLIQCNSSKWLDYNNKKQTTKFLTLTFQDNITDITEANKELTKFFKRLSYHQYKIRKNVIKYISVPELQKRGVWHYHIVLFNSKYTPFQELKNIWGKGSVYINAIKKDMDTTDIAKYITKYITKALKLDNNSKENDNLGNYDTYLKLDMINKKRYSCSKGLLKPIKSKIKMNEEEKSFLFSSLSKKSIIRDEEKQIYYKEYENDYRGQVKILVVELTEQDKKALIRYLKTRFKVDIEVHSKEEKINFKKLRKIHRQGKKDTYLHYLDRAASDENDYIKYHTI